MRIGGDFEVEPNFFSRSRNKNIVFLNQKNMQWLDLGRNAINVAIKDILSKGAIKKVYLPYYACASVLKPFKELNFEIIYYSMGCNLKSPNIKELNIENNSIVLFINYFGIENLIYKELENEKRYKNFFLIEDNVQAAFSTFFHPLSDYKVYSFRKFLSVPDGSLIIAKEEFNKSILLENVNEEFITKQMYGKILRNEEVLTSRYLTLLKDSEEQLDKLSIVPRLMSDISQYMLERIDVQKNSDIRRENWTYMLDKINSNLILREYITPLFDNIKNFEVPLGLPIKMNSPRLRDELLLALRKENIYCPQHWKLDAPENQISFLKDDFNLSKKILTLPIDQRMNRQHVEYFIGSLEKILRSL